MMVRIFVCLFLIFHSPFANSQIVIADTAGNAIPFVQLNSNNPLFFAQSDLNGRLNYGALYKLEHSDTLFLHHVSFISSFYPVVSLKPGDTLMMLHKNYELPVFTISNSERDPEYRKIAACYRSFQLNNDSMMYYADGMVEFSTKFRRNNYKVFRKQNRSLANRAAIDDLPHHKVGITFRLAAIPRPPTDYLPSEFLKKHDLLLLPLDGERVVIITRDSIRIGIIEKSGPYQKFSIHDIFSERSRKALQTEVVLERMEVTLLFRNEDGDISRLPDHPDDLVYFNQLQDFKVKNDKEKEYTHIVGSAELFIENVWYTQDKGDTEYSPYFGFQKENSFNTKFWKSCDCPVYDPPEERLVRSVE